MTSGLLSVAYRLPFTSDSKYNQGTFFCPWFFPSVLPIPLLPCQKSLERRALEENLADTEGAQGVAWYLELISGKAQTVNQNSHKAHRETRAWLVAQGGWFTDGCCLEVGCQEDRHEAEEGSQTGGIPAVALAVLVEDVDLGWLEVETGIDLNHGAGPEEDRQVS